MPEIEIVVADDRKRLRQFVGFPYRLYADHPYWVPPLRSEEEEMLGARHPFFRHASRELLLAVRAGETVGRIAAIVDRNAPPEQGSFGYFDCVDDAGVARALIDAARRWLHEQGARLMRGPFSPSPNYISGVLIDGFDDPPCLGMPYNRPYYDALLLEAGLEKAKDLLALSIDMDQLRGPKAQRMARFALSFPGLKLRAGDARRMESEAQLLWETYVKAWSGNWGYVPPSPDEFRSFGKQLLAFSDERMVQFIEYQGKTVGVILACPDLNQALQRAKGSLWPLGWWHIVRIKKTATRARVVLLGLAPEWQGKGAAAAFLAMAQMGGLEHYRQVEASWILEDNLAALRGLDLLGARVYKRYRLYEAPAP